MNRIPILAGLATMIMGCAAKKDFPSVKSLLVQQLKNTHTDQDWFVPVKIAVDGLTVQQSNWKDSTDNHSIGELVSHLIFWNERVLIAFKGNVLPDFNDDNELTFQKINERDWELAAKKLDSIQTEWERVTEKATQKQVKEWSASIANIAAHNAYHTGQIIYIRKRNGWWN
jgi:hypothetical protein